MNSNEIKNDTIINIQEDNINNVEQNKSLATIKRKKYWLIPLSIFAFMVFSILFVLFPVFLKIWFNIDFNQQNIIYITLKFLVMFGLGICGIAFVPSIIISIILTIKNK